MKATETASVSSSAASVSCDFGGDWPPLDDGEYAILAATLVDLVVKSDHTVRSSDTTTTTSAPPGASDTAFYGSPLSKEEAAKRMPPGSGGLVWNAIVIPDNFCSENGSILRGLNRRDFNVANNTASIKTRRPSLPITVTQLFSSLTKIEDTGGSPRYIFNGVLNGWPSLCTFELIALEKKRSIGPLTPPDYMDSSKLTWAHYWGVDDEVQTEPSILNGDKKIFRAKLCGAPWTSMGWSPESPGFLFWYEAQRPEAPRVTYGTTAAQSVGDDNCSMVHMISHRYAVGKETARDKVTYHSVVLLEWDHGKYCTLIECAYLNGMGGYRGRSNWYHDRDEQPETGLYRAFPPEMICPWLTSAAEVRCYDVEARSLVEMKAYIAKYEAGMNKRFLDPKYTFSHPVRLFFRSKSNIAQYLVNYISRDSSYSELRRNCQTLAADLCCFLAGKKDVVPYHPINRIDYRNRTHLFLYDSGMFSRCKPAGIKK